VSDRHFVGVEFRFDAGTAVVGALPSSDDE
jgi:hypothetical protein